MMKIKCESFEVFMDVIESCVKKGLTFMAYAESYEIELKGGY